jgi:hypothetical protein
MSTLKGSRQRRRLWSVTQAVVRAPGGGGEETPSVPESSGDGYEEEGEDEEEGEIAPTPHSLPPEDLPSLGDLFSQQTRIYVGMRQTRRPRTGTRASSSLLPQSGPMLVYSNLQGMSVCTSGDRNNSLVQGFVGPATLANHQGCCICDGEVILIGY